MKDTRITLVGRHYATKSRKSVPVKTPGGRLVAQVLTKKTKGPRCSDCKTPLKGIKHLKTSAYRNLKKRDRTVSRAYGGKTCGSCIRSRIMRAFLLEEHKAVKKLMADKK
mmetsp:Transcript_6226/g.7178  ORF Transcript_6226/g.7178 Transcript_6226/m.7178 type:complete len:110 (-) Transcript_6226:47-376(-)|eukprot:CAMPEP_0204615048 /NCGR_PEP_ID=MMETSP0717-20131115/2646_1 /ASSEMBLY_ACC=CAM_ASM_000666 /TAXON_ID=230516 /ORGANISM="Chaetoceros curvisetus" /LENGTH=109 /DNA_ID=CAMNT_0051627897 /DNA_START=235 /DNA_END=564 /DNA_ORIENTATION=-